MIVVGTYGDPAETDGCGVLGGPLWKRLPAVQEGDGVAAAELVLEELETTLAG